MKYLFCNWKMYLGLAESKKLITKLGNAEKPKDDISVCVFPNYLAIDAAVEELKDSFTSIGAQHVAWTPSGAYTGAVSAELAKSAGCSYALVGHSERRHIFGETNEDVRKRFEACRDAGLIPVLCVGETQEDLDAGKTEYRLKKQLAKVLENQDLSVGAFLVAYEPVWAIGTGNSCDPEKAQEMHTLIKNEIKQYTDAQIPILYGGSVMPENVLLYVSKEEIDGVLVGGASTKEDSLLALLTAFNAL